MYKKNKKYLNIYYLKTWTPEKNNTEEVCELLEALALALAVGVSFCVAAVGFFGGLYFKDSFVELGSTLALNNDANLL